VTSAKVVSPPRASIRSSPFSEKPAQRLITVNGVGAWGIRAVANDEYIETKNQAALNEFRTGLGLRTVSVSDLFRSSGIH